MKKIFILAVLIISGCNDSQSESDLLHKKNPDGNYGSEIYLREYNLITELFDTPEIYLGDEVLISGEIIEVCPMRGCWINIKETNSDLHIRVKVTDGEIVFPLTSKGKYADVQGKFSKLEFTEEQARQWKIHLAEEKGIHLDSKDIIINPSDLVEYRIIGEGANIYSYGCKN